MTYNKKTYLLIVIIAVTVILLAGAFFLVYQNSKKKAVVFEGNLSSIGIEVSVPQKNEVISSPLKIKGVVGGSGWAGFEGQVGTVTLLGGDGKELAKTFLPATSDWTKLPTSFEANLDFTSPKAGDGFLVFHNENASGQAAQDKTVILPIKFK